MEEAQMPNAVVYDLINRGISNYGIIIGNEIYYPIVGPVKDLDRICEWQEPNGKRMRIYLSKEEVITLLRKGFVVIDNFEKGILKIKLED
jgi:hypothetical protein